MLLALKSILWGGSKECTYNNEKLYFRNQVPCCDQMHPLYRLDGTYFCSPSGGFTGGGDGKCPQDIRKELRCKDSLGNYAPLNPNDF